MSDTERPSLAEIASVDQKVRRESYEWGVAHGRNESAELEAIVRDLATRTDFLETYDTCPLCGAFDPPEHTPMCAQRRAVEFFSAHPVSGTEGTDA